MSSIVRRRCYVAPFGTADANVILLSSLACSDYSLQGKQDVLPGEPGESAEPLPGLDVSPRSHELASMGEAAVQRLKER